MRLPSLCLSALLLGLVALPARADPFPSADVSLGHQMHRQHCVACHVRQVGGDGSDLYLRLDRRVETPSALRQQLTTCTTQLRLGWFPDDEEHVAGFLNRHFYRFGLPELP